MSVPSPEPPSTPKVCEITEMEAEWCAHCTGASPKVRHWGQHYRCTECRELIPMVHDGRHGRKCARCVSHNRKERNAARLRV